jgi:hypothetical protein
VSVRARVCVYVCRSLFFEPCPFSAQYFVGFAFTVAAIYLLFLVILIVLGLRHFTKMRGGNRFFLALTLSTVIVILAGFFANAYVSSVDGTNAAFAASYLIANLVCRALACLCSLLVSLQYSSISLSLSLSPTLSAHTRRSLLRPCFQYVAWLCIAYVPQRRDSEFDSTMARESIDADSAVDTTGVMAASGDLDVSAGEVDLGDGGSVEQSTVRSASRVGADRRRTAASVSHRGGGKRDIGATAPQAAQAAATSSHTGRAGPSFAIAEDDGEEEGNA